MGIVVVEEGGLLFGEGVCFHVGDTVFVRAEKGGSMYAQYVLTKGIAFSSTSSTCCRCGVENTKVATKGRATQCEARNRQYSKRFGDREK